MLYKMVQTCDSVLISVDVCEVSVPYQTKEQYFFTMHATRGSVDILLWINYPNTTIVMKLWGITCLWQYLLACSRCVPCLWIKPQM